MHNVASQPYIRAYIDRGEGRIMLTFTDNMVSVLWRPGEEKAWVLCDVSLIFRGKTLVFEKPWITKEGRNTIWTFDTENPWAVNTILLLHWCDGHEEFQVNPGPRPKV